MVREYRGPKPCRDEEGNVLVQFGQSPECEELPPHLTVSVIGWGGQLLASAPTKEELLAVVARRFKKFRIVD